MPPSAVERAPVEVWLRIIRFALASPLSPAPGGNILDYRDVFLTRCDSDRIALVHESNVNSFRLVCKSWNATVKKLQQKTTLCDFGKLRRYDESLPLSKPECVPLHLFQKPTPSPNELPPATRIEVWTPRRYCYCLRPTCRYKNVSTSQNHPASDLQVAPRSGASTSTIESLLIGIKVDEDYLCSLLDAMTSLRALSCRIRDRPMWKTIFQRATCQGLTHLQVRVSWIPFCRSLSHISLPKLVYLRVIFHRPPWTSDRDNPPLSNVNWCAQPKLRYLDLEGVILKRRRDEFYAFLAVDRPNLSGLILRVQPPEDEPYEYLALPNLSLLFPNLTSFGVEMAAFIVKPLPPAPSMTSVDLILFFSTLNVWFDARDSTVAESIHAMCSEWRPKRIMLPTTWEAEEEFVICFKFTEKMSKPFYLPQYAQFFQLLKEEGITVVDREGRSTETADGRRYVQLLEVYGFDKYDNGLKLHEAWGDTFPKALFMTGRLGGPMRLAEDSD